jgi:quercetin dioxygenase-like cupin family protein
MFKKILMSVLFTGICLPFIATASEDAVIADPAHYTVEFENDRVRIIRIKYGPGEKSVMHTHGPNASVILSTGTIRMHFPDGTTEDLASESGLAMWSDGDEHLPENVSDKPMEVVLVELKD